MQVGQLLAYPPILGCELSCLERGVAVGLQYGALHDVGPFSPVFRAARESPA